MIPTGEKLRISSRLALNGRTTEKIFSSRIRRAINCEYCASKSRTTMAWFSCDWASTDECLKSVACCKGAMVAFSSSLAVPVWRLLGLEAARVNGLVVHNVQGFDLPLHQFCEAAR